MHAFQTKPGEMAVLFFDITDRKRAEEELQAYRDRLELLVEKRTLALKTTQKQLVAAERLAVLGKFAGAIAHEIRNPLTVIANCSYYLQRHLGGADHKTHDQLERIDRQVARTTEIIDSILKLTRPSPSVKERVDLQALVHRCLERVEVPETISVVWEFPGEPPQVNADPEQLAIAVENLLRNAAQAMAEGGVLSLRCRPVDRGDLAGFEVSFADTGSGILASDLESIFEPLFTTKSFGVGLGLAIVRLILDRHEGDVGASSTDGEGAVFTLWLPE